jgi:hypothetical protein
MAKESCIAWLPRIKDATTINHLKLADSCQSVPASAGGASAESSKRVPDSRRSTRMAKTSSRAAGAVFSLHGALNLPHMTIHNVIGRGRTGAAPCGPHP